MKNIKRIAAVLLVLVMAMALTGCGKAKLNGTWLVTGGTAMDSITGGIDLAELGMEMAFAFNDGGKLDITLSFMGESETMNGTWEVDGDNITMTMDGDPLAGTFEIDGDKCTMTFSDGTLEFTKKN